MCTESVCLPLSGTLISTPGDSFSSQLLIVMDFTAAILELAGNKQPAQQ